MPYSLYKSDGTLLVTLADNTIDNTTTSLNLIGKKKIGFGQAQNQSLVYLLENFAKTTAPTTPVKGQVWFDSTTNVLKVCTNTVGPVWEKVNRAKPATSAPGVDLQDGELWWDNDDQKLYAYSTTLTSWVLVGPIINPAASNLAEYLITATTTNAATTELFINGVTNSRMVIPNNKTWNFQVDISARRTDVANGDAGGWTFNGVIDNTTNNVTLVAPASLVSQAANQAWTVSIAADNTNKALVVSVVGEVSKSIAWIGVVKAIVSP